MTDPTNVLAPPSPSADQPSLEEIAAQIQAANAKPGLDESPVAATTPEPPAPTAPSVDTIESRVNTPAPKSATTSIGLQIANLLAEKEVIGTSQVNDVAGVLTPEVLQKLNNTPSQKSAVRITATIPISFIEKNGQETTLSINTADILAYLSGQSDAITTSSS